MVQATSERKSAIIPIGPYHPALKEPEYFKLYVEGEKVVGLDVRIGYIHRGVEYLAERKTLHQDVFLIERICGICSNVHTLCFCQAVEEAMGIDIPDRARYIRTIIAELERIHSHLLWAGVAAHVIGYDTLFMHFWKYREPICETLEMITGNRQHYAMNYIGGVRRDLDTEKYGERLSAKIDELKTNVGRLVEAVIEDPLIKSRMQGVGVLTAQDARKYCAVGPTVRGSGIAVDVRKNEPYAAYRDIDFNIHVFDSGDVLARTLVRLNEVIESTQIIKKALEAMPEGPIRAELEKVPIGEGIGKAEAPRGEDIHYVVLNGTNMPERVKVRAPSYVNIPAIAPAIIGSNLADAPIILMSVDPCFSCTDRVAIVNRQHSKSVHVPLEELVRNPRKVQNSLR